MAAEKAPAVTASTQADMRRAFSPEKPHGTVADG